MNEIELIICITITALVAFFVLKKKEKKNFDRSSVKLTNPNGVLLDNLLKQKKDQKLTPDQRSVIANNIGLYHWLPEDLFAP